MSAAVVFILFVICLVIAIPVSISLGIVAAVSYTHLSDHASDMPRIYLETT